MVDHPTNLDAHRGMAAQKATDLRRLRSEVEADQAALHARPSREPDLSRDHPLTAGGLYLDCPDQALWRMLSLWPIGDRQ